MRYKGLFPAIVLAALVSICSPHVAYSDGVAQSSPFTLSNKKDSQSSDLDGWLAVKASLEKSGQGLNHCEESWDVLWPWAKKGNLEARFTLFFLMTPPPDMKPLFAPGSSGDRISWQRDVIIMLTHSLGYKGDPDLKDNQLDVLAHYNDALALYKKFGLGSDYKSVEFLKCAQENKDNCAAIAVKNKIVPSFEEYAQQIDLFLEKGMKAHCVNSN